MQTRICVIASLVCCATAFVPTARAADSAMTYSPTLNSTNQRFVAPEDSARPGESFFYKAAVAASKEQYGLAAHLYQPSASWAFKPAQYNLGVMYFNGEGVPADRALGMAWLALAAEREKQEYTSARDTAFTKMSSDEFGSANELWRDMRKAYGDQVALQRAKNRWLQVRRAATGSHLGEGMGHLQVGGREKSEIKVNNKANSSTFNAFGITGGGSVDESIAYSRLRISDNPYDVKLKQPIGTATVKDLIPIGDGVNAESKTKKPNFY